MTTTPTVPEQLQSMVAPGQEGVLDQFLNELEQQDAAIADAEQQPADAEPQLLAGKFKTTEDLEKSYLELQKKLGQRATEPAAEPAAEPEAAPLTREQAVGHYGESIVAAAEEAGIDLGAWDKAVKAGKDTTEQRQKLAEQTGIPAQLIEQYEAAFRPRGNDPVLPDSSTTTNAGLTDSDVSELKQLVGGEQEFQRLSQWAKANMGQDELADYNDAVDSGNKAAVRLALRAMQARSQTNPQGEPELIGGGRAARAEVFNSQEEALAAMRKTDSNGKRLYNTDSKYKAWFEQTLARSNYPT